jgi:aldose 1-epimerase
MQEGIAQIKKLNEADFQTEIKGKHTDLYYLQSESGIIIAITNFGGRVVSLLTPDRNCNFEDIVLGFDTIDGYLNSNEIYYGALIGRYGNRISDGRFFLDGKEFSLIKNEKNNHLHGGIDGFHNVVWDAEKLDDQNLRLTYVSNDGEQGYPGQLFTQVMYSLTNQNELRIEYSAFSSKKTIINLTSHSYFNLKGEGSGTVENHKIFIDADFYTAVDKHLIPSGISVPVTGSPFDFKEPTEIGLRINQDNPQLSYGNGFDHNFILNKHYESKLSTAAKVIEPKSGRVLEILTTEPGLQFYSGNGLDGRDSGKSGKAYEFRTAFCLEPQHFPDSPNYPEFPSTELNPGEMHHSITIYRFTTQ